MISSALLTLLALRAANAAEPAAQRTARVHLESDRPVQLAMKVGPGAYRTVCASPCDAELALDATYRVTGATIRSSTDFDIVARPGEHVTLAVDTRTNRAFVAGIVVTSVGGALAIGSLFYFVGRVVGGWTGSDSSGLELSEREARARDKEARNNETMTVFGGLLGAGVGLVAVGLPLTLANRRTHVDPLRDGPKRDDDASNAPVVRAPEVTTREWLPPRASAIVVPLGISF